jgi:hypothetical protein
MKRVKNLTENKVLINTFKKLKTKIHLNKGGLKNSTFYLLKYNRLVFFKAGLTFIIRNSSSIFLKKLLLNSVNQKKNFTNFNKPFIKTLLMFIN